MTLSYHHVDYVLGEFAYAIKSLCDYYDFTPENLRKIKYSEIVETILNDKSLARYVKSIPFEIDIPTQMVPNISQSSKLSMEMSLAPGSDEYDRHGIAEYRIRRDHKKPWNDPDNQLIFWRWSGLSEQYPLGSWVYFVKKEELRSFYRAILSVQKHIADVDMPVLPGNMLQDIYLNSIKFLQEGREKKEEYKKARIPYRRGLLFCGNPGSGKTLTCKWLRQLCIAKNFAYRIVTIEEYRNAMSTGITRRLFRLPENTPGIIFFDDMDIYVKDRKNGISELQTFLTEMDGIKPTEGVVYVFTTNVVKELDKAFVRPGRIDLYLPFRAPTKKLRERFIKEKFDKKILEEIDVDKIVEKTNEYSFAEIEEIRKLLTMDIFRGKEISVQKTFSTFELHRKEFQQHNEMGFGAKLDDGDDDYYIDDDTLDLNSIIKSL